MKLGHLGCCNRIVHFPLFHTAKFWGYVKWNLHFINNSCIVIRSLNRMKQFAQELIECGIHQ